MDIEVGDICICERNYPLRQGMFGLQKFYALRDDKVIVLDIVRNTKLEFNTYTFLMDNGQFGFNGFNDCEVHHYFQKL